ncbi:bifunctional adenosylcobinamide kinase/adenosylcobinamide-phosphate guanylyltransferase [Pseudalkalibacillus sp. Hm43]|uniref:bifunctional adenosylcobinamide kinase/adenosylcobinamide-phosphate guanylyltransferase n=1 Tax=Pseudalkalibacillus sp. Hm43 TaxID=3450742 RepID=UPI003F426542
MKIVFISGGVRSGKSRFAEKLAQKASLNSVGKLQYVATGVPTDPEMESRIQRHQQDRRLDSWNTIEQATDIRVVAKHFQKTDIVLLDCLTTWLNNEFFIGGEKRGEHIRAKMVEDIEMIARSCHTLILVSNDVFFDAATDSEVVLTYKKVLGKIHQQVVERASEAFHVECGIPIVMKGVT